MCESSDESVSELSILADSGSDEWLPSDLDLPGNSGKKSTRFGNVDVDSNSSSEEQQGNCARNLTHKTTTSNSSKVLEYNGLTKTATPTKNTNKKNIVKSALLSPTSSNCESVNTSCVTDSKFFIPYEICELFVGFKEPPETIFEYYFDSSSGEENTSGSELKPSGSLNDSYLYSYLLHLKKKKSNVWKTKCKESLKKSLAKTIHQPFHIKTPNSVVSSDKGSEASTSKQYSYNYTNRLCINKSLTDNSEQLVENENSAKVVNEDQQQSQNRKNILDTLLLEQPSPYRTENSVHILDNISPTQTSDSDDEKHENTNDIKIQIVNESAQNCVEKENESEILGNNSNNNLQNSAEKASSNSSLFLESSNIIFFDRGKDWSERKSPTEEITCEFGAFFNDENMGKFKNKSKHEKSSSGGSLKNVETSFELYKPSISTAVEHQSSIENVKTNANVSVTNIKPHLSVRVKKNGQHDQRSIHNISSDDSDLEQRITSVLSENKKDTGEYSFSDNYQKDSNRTSGGYVIKLSSDSESDSNLSSKRTNKTLMPSPVTNRSPNRLFPASSNNCDPDISKSKNLNRTSFEMNHSNSQNNKEFMIDFNEDLYRENEIWLLKYPMKIDMCNIRGQSLNMSNRTVIHDHGNKYECYVNPTDSSLQSVNLALPTKNNKFSLHVVPITGSITFEEIVDVPKVTSVTVKPKRKLAIPDNLKVRHPILCLDYHDQPKIPVIEYDKGKKKHKKIDRMKIDSEENEAIFNSVKSKKRKMESENELSSTFNSEENDIEIRSMPKKKKRRRENEDILVPNTDTTDTSINNLSWSKKKKKRNNSELMEIEEETQSYVEKSSPKKRKKKDKKKE